MHGVLLSCFAVQSCFHLGHGDNFTSQYLSCHVYSERGFFRIETFEHVGLPVPTHWRVGHIHGGSTTRVVLEHLAKQLWGGQLLTLFEKWLYPTATSLVLRSYAAGGRTFSLRTSHSLTLTGPVSPRKWARKLLQTHCSGDATKPRFTGLRCM